MKGKPLTSEERLARIEHLIAGWIEQSKLEHQENRRDRHFPAQKKKLERLLPLLTPVASLIVAMASLYMVVQNGKLSQQLNRPFVIPSYVQKTIPRSAPDAEGHHGIVSAGILTFKNSGNSPAYKITINAETSLLRLAWPEPFTLAAHDSHDLNPAAWWAKPGFTPDYNAHSTYNVPGNITYEDSYGKEYKEPTRFMVQVGGDAITPNPFFK